MFWLLILVLALLENTDTDDDRPTGNEDVDVDFGVARQNANQDDEEEDVLLIGVKKEEPVLIGTKLNIDLVCVVMASNRIDFKVDVEEHLLRRGFSSTRNFLDSFSCDDAEQMVSANNGNGEDLTNSFMFDNLKVKKNYVC